MAWSLDGELLDLLWWRSLRPNGRSHSNATADEVEAVRSMVGDCLGPYRILEPLGAGGMGEVYLAEDTRLGRKVAVKVLPAEFAAVAERLARFEQEARAAAALNHPHIAVVHDIGFEPGKGSKVAAEASAVAAAEDEVVEGGTHFIVLEYLEGHSLRDRLDEGPLTLSRALQLATEIAEALAAAHGAGIVHRDLKPDNVFVTREGHAKVLDFGLAKLTEVSVTVSPGGSRASRSPTMVGTVAGQVMGTAGYMAPEQVEGREVDHRADLFAFGCLLYEMATGRQPFAGKSVHDTLHRIVDEEPRSVGELDPGLPLKLQWVVEKCLQKDPDARYQSASELAVDLRGLAVEVSSGRAVAAGAGSSLAAAAVTGTRGANDTGPSGRLRFLGSGRSLSLPVALALAALVGLASGVAVWVGGRPGSRPLPVQRFRIAAPGLGVTLAAGDNLVGISPDGRRLAYLAAGPEAPGLMLRRLDQLEAAPLQGVALNPIGYFYPRFSPDDRWLLVSSPAGLYRIPMSGGEPFRLAEGNPSVYPMGVWAGSDTVVYSDRRALWRVDAAGGAPELLSQLPSDENALYWLADLLPGDRYALLDRERGSRAVDVVVAEVDSGDIVTVVAEAATTPRFLPTGHVVFARGGALEAVAFDTETARVLGTPVPVVDGVYIHPGSRVASYAVSDTGTLAYVPADLPGARFSLVWVDRDGSETLIRTFAESWPLRPRLSPDGRRMAADWEAGAGGERGIRVWDLERGGSIQLSHEGASFDPVWVPGGERIVFSSNRGELEALFWRRADGLGPEEPIPGVDRSENAYSFSPDGTEMATYGRDATTQGDRDIYVRSVADDWERRPILATEFNERSPAFSPDGRWLAYASDESGQDEVYVLRYPELDVKHVISTDGGREPAWSADGTELFYRREDEIFAVGVRTEPEFRADLPVRLFGGPYRREFGPSGSRSYDVSADGRFLMVRFDTVAEGSEGEIVIVLNWFEELERLVPRRR